MKSIKLCIIGNANSIHILRWCKYFKEIGYSVHVISLIGNEMSLIINKNEVNDEYEKLEIPVHPIPGFRILKSLFKKRCLITLFTELERCFIYICLTYILGKIKPDIINAHYLTDNGYWAAKMNFHPLLASVWGSDISTVKIGSHENYKLKTIFNNADVIQTHDKQGENQLLALGCERNKIWIQQGHGVDLNTFNPKFKSNEIRLKLGYDVDKCVIICVRALNEKYNISTLIKSMKTVIERNNKIQLVIIGDGDNKNEYLELIEMLNLSKSVQLLGKIDYDSLNLYYANADIYVDPYYTSVGGGGRGLATLEAMASCLPIISANRPGVENVVVDNINGYTFKGSDPHDLCEKILTLSRDKNMISNFGIASRNLAQRGGDWEINMNQIKLKYIEMINKKLGMSDLYG